MDDDDRMDVDWEGTILKIKRVPGTSVSKRVLDLFQNLDLGSYELQHLSDLLGQIRVRDDRSEHAGAKRFKFSEGLREGFDKYEEKQESEDDSEAVIRLIVANSRRRGINNYELLEQERKASEAAKQRIEKMRRKAQAEELQREKERQVTCRLREKLNSDLKGLRCWEALNRLYPQARLSWDSGQAVFVKTIRKAMAVYHPDKNHNASIEKLAECNEIFKVLNSMRESQFNELLRL